MEKEEEATLEDSGEMRANERESLILVEGVNLPVRSSLRLLLVTTSVSLGDFWACNLVI